MPDGKNVSGVCKSDSMLPEDTSGIKAGVINRTQPVPVLRTRLAWRQWSQVGDKVLLTRVGDAERARNDRHRKPIGGELSGARNESLRLKALQALQQVELKFRESREAVDRILLAAKARKEERESKADLESIESGHRLFPDIISKDLAFKAASDRFSQATAEVVRIGKIQYVRPMKLIGEYAEAAEQYLQIKEAVKAPCQSSTETAANNTFAEQEVLVTSNDSSNGAFVKQIVEHIDDMLSSLPHARQGVKGEPDLAVFDGLNPVLHLKLIRQHIAKKVTAMDANWAAKVEKATENTVVQQAFSRADSGHFPEDSAIMFFENGKLVQKKGLDGNFYPQFFDVKRYKDGQGRLDRLVGHQPEGYVVIIAKTGADGRPVERLAKGKTMIVKEVLDLDGVVPEGIAKGTTLGRILRDFRGPVEAPAALAEPQN